MKNRRVSNDVIAEVLVESMRELSFNLDFQKSNLEQVLQGLKELSEELKEKKVKVDISTVTQELEQYKRDFSDLNHSLKKLSNQTENNANSVQNLSQKKDKLWIYYGITTMAFLFCIFLAFKAGSAVMERDTYRKKYLDTEEHYQRAYNSYYQLDEELNQFLEVNPNFKKKWEKYKKH